MHELMAGGRHALVLAVGSYEDAKLSALRAPAADAAALEKVLADPRIGGFAVTSLVDQTAHVLRRAIQRFFADRSRDDLLLVYLSCHGFKDDEGRLYFTASDTEVELLDATAVPATYLDEQIGRSRAKSVVVLLDCCYSGAFKLGSKGDRGAHLRDALGGSGYAVLTASNALEYAFEGETLSDAAPVRSKFTEAIVSGLESGAADLDEDGVVTVDELYAHVRETLRTSDRKQTPQRWLAGGEGNLAVANNPHGATTAALPPHLLAALASPQPDERLQAVAALRSLNFSASAAIAALARKTLENLLEDDSPKVSASAVAALGLQEVSRSNVPVPGRSPANALRAGVFEATDLLCRTFGPRPRTVMLEQDGVPHYLTDSLQIMTTMGMPEDPWERAGAEGVRDLVAAVRSTQADGATTAAIIFAAVVDVLLELVGGGASPVLLRRELTELAEGVLASVSRQAKDLETIEEIAQVLETAFQDPSVGGIIAKAMDKVGKECVITVEKSNTFGLELELTEGMRFNRGYISPYFVTDIERMECVLEDPYVLVVDARIGSLKDVLPLMEKVVQSGRPLAVIAEDVEGEALATLVINKTRGTLKSVAVKAPGLGDHRKALLQDIAILTGGRVISEELGLKFDTTGLEMLGRARKVVITKDETTIVGGAGDDDQIGGRAGQIRAEIEQSDSDSDREKLQERLAKLVGGVAVIRVGATTQAELDQRVLLSTRAVSVARGLPAGGLMLGGGVALRAGSLGIDPTSGLGVGRALVSGLRAPAEQLALGAGVVSSDEVYERSTEAEQLQFVIDARNGKLSIAAAAGIWDSAATARQAVAGAIVAADRLLALL